LLYTDLAKGGGWWRSRWRGRRRNRHPGEFWETSSLLNLLHSVSSQKLCKVKELQTSDINKKMVAAKIIL